MKVFKPDSAGLIYPYVKNKTRSSVFRIEAELKESIDVHCVLAAISQLRKRFPTFFVKLIIKNKMYMLKSTDDCGVVFEEQNIFCRTFDYEKDIPFRMIVYKNRIALEAFHMLADGHGALIFFKTLLAHYYNLKGEHIRYEKEILNPKLSPDAEGISDAFLDIYKGGNKKVSRIGSFAYQYCNKEPHTNISVTHLKVPAEELQMLAKWHNTTVGILLVSIYIYSFYQLKSRKSNREIKISVPADLRRFFPSKTVRNFSLYAIVGISPQKEIWTLDKIITVVTKQMREQLTKENLLNMVYTNVTSANTPFFKQLPMSVKKAVLKFGFDYMGERLFTSAFSNVGVVDLPDSLKHHVTDIRIFTGETVVNQINAVASTYNGFANIIFSSRVTNDEVQRMYASILNENGLSVECFIRSQKNKDYENVSDYFIFDSYKN